MLCTENAVFFCGYCGRYRPVEGRHRKHKHGWICAACLEKTHKRKENEQEH